MARLINRDPRLVSARLMSKVRAVCADVTGHLSNGRRLELFEGWRDRRQQALLVRDGFSKTLHSKHTLSPARAADVMFQRLDEDGRWKWLSWQKVPRECKDWLLSAKRAHGVARDGLEWDSPHCELKR